MHIGVKPHFEFNGDKIKGGCVQCECVKTKLYDVKIGETTKKTIAPVGTTKWTI